jgi:hypothetical protein
MLGQGILMGIFFARMEAEGILLEALRLHIAQSPVLMLQTPPFKPSIPSPFEANKVQ